MNFPSLLEQYVRLHFRSLDDSAKLHLRGFAAHCENAWHDAQAVTEKVGAEVIGKVAEVVSTPKPVHVEAVVHPDTEPTEAAQPESKEE